MFFVLLTSSAEDSRFCENLYREHYRRMLDKAVRMLHSKEDAEDVVEDAFVWIVKNLHIVKQLNCNIVKYYLLKIIENGCKNKLRRDQTRPSLATDQQQEDFEEGRVGITEPDSVLTTVLIQELQNELAEQIRLLPEGDSQLLKMRREGWSFEEISEMTGVASNTLRSRHSRLRARLLKNMQWKEGAK